MKLDARCFSIAFASTWTIGGLLCAWVFKAAPAFYYKAANLLLHSDMYRPGREVGWGELLMALAVWWVLVAGLASAAAVLYNIMLPKMRV
jgi:hypothetical protein